MPRSSRSKSHKQSKHSGKEAVAAKEYTDSEEDVLKMKAKNGKEDSSASVRVSRDSASGEKRKFTSSQLKDGKDLSGLGNGDALGDYVSSKRRKEKESDRWSGGGGDEKVEGGNVEKEIDKVLKSKDSKSGVVEVKSKSSGRRHESGNEKKEETVSVIGEKEESKGGGSRSELKRKAEKDSGRKDGHQYKDSKESKEKDRGSDRERKTLDGKRDAEGRAVDGEVPRKQGEDQQNKKGREIAEFPVEDGVRNPELEKELEKRIRRRGETSVEKDKYQDGVRESDDKRVSVRADRSKDARNKDERLKEESYSDKYKEDGDRENRNREEKYKEDVERDNRHRDAKYREDGDRDRDRYKDDKYREDGDRDYRHREDKYREDGNRDIRHKEDKYREDVDRDSRRRDDKYREGGERNDRNRDDKYREDGDRDYRHKEEKYREDIDREGRPRDGRPRDEIDREKRARDAKYKDVHTSRDRPSDPETKRFKDDVNVADMYYRKSINRDTSPIYDDRVNRYKDDKDRRGNDKEDPSDSRSQSTKEQRPDSEKRSMISAKVDPVTDRGRANSRNTDLDVVVNNSRRRSSPGSSSYSARDHYRVSKQEESKYRDYAFDERARHNLPSNRDFVSTPGPTERLASSRSLEKPFQKDDSHLAELPLERRPNRTSPLQLVDKSPSSTSNDRRNLNRSDVRRNLDVEESGQQRSSGSKDVRDYSGKGNRELPIENPPIDEFSQADGDNLSVSSPYTRNNHLPGNSKSLLPPPPPPFKGGSDSPSVFGSAEDERGNNKSNNRHRRMSDPNMGRPQNAWKGVPNWQSPMPNGYMPFQHGPPPFGVHPVMQQFPPPMFGVRPPMDLGHNGLPYHMPDGDRFSAHGRPPMHGWDANNAAFGDEHIFGRLDWDRNRNPMGGNRGWESSNDMWKGQNSQFTMDMQSTPQREDYSARKPAEDTLTSQSGQPVENEQNQLDFQAESINISQSSETLDGKTPEAPKITAESPIIYETSKEEESRVCQIYLSKIDISEDLTEPDLYGQCSDMMDLDQTTTSDELDYKIMYIEDSVESRGKIPDKTPSAVLFTAINESVFQKAMSLYKKQKEEYGALNGEKLPPPNVNGLDHKNDGQQVDKVKASDNSKLPEEAEGAVIDCIQEKAEQIEKPEINLTTDTLMSDDVIVNNSLMEMEVDPLPVKKEPESMAEEKSPAVETVEQSSVPFPVKSEEVNDAGDNSKEEDIRLVDSKCGGGDVSSSTEEAIECGSVNLSRIHHSPESTH